MRARVQLIDALLCSASSLVPTNHWFACVQDGTQVQFKSALRKTYITADQGGGGAVLANRTQASDWETFKVSRRLNFVAGCAITD